MTKYGIKRLKVTNYAKGAKKGTHPLRKVDFQSRCRACASMLSDDELYTSSVSAIEADLLDYYFKKCNSCGTLTSQDYDWNELYASRDSSNYAAGSPRFIKMLKSWFLSREYSRQLNGIDFNSNIVDYGCGSGEFSNVLFELGYSNVTAADLQNDRPNGLTGAVKYSTITFTNLKNADVVFARHVWEHLADPISELKEIHARMKIDAKFIMEVPNKDSIFRDILGRHWPGYFAPFHTVVYSRKGLTELVTKCGFVIEEFHYKESPIFGTIFYNLGFPYVLARLLSGFVYPFQKLMSKLTCSSEAMLVVLVKK